MPYLAELEATVEMTLAAIRHAEPPTQDISRIDTVLPVQPARSPPVPVRLIRRFPSRPRTILFAVCNPLLFATTVLMMAKNQIGWRAGLNMVITSSGAAATLNTVKLRSRSKTR